MEANQFCNFGLKPSEDHVQVWQQGGQCINTLQHSTAFSCIQHFKPTILVLDLGTNNLDSATADPQHLAQ